MTEERETRALHWPERSRDRGLCPIPKQIPPHPEYGDLPPCDGRIAGGKPCPRPATTHYGFSYYCDEHLAWVEAGHEEDDASMAVYHAKRFLWRARVEGIDRLEYHLGQALVECERDLEEAKKAGDEATRRVEDV